jgi:hypothetical protein
MMETESFKMNFFNENLLYSSTAQDIPSQRNFHF